MNIVFLGGGRITSAMLAGLRLAKTKHRLIVHDRNRGKLRTLKELYGAVVEPDLRKAVAAADLLLIAVRPGSVRELLQTIGKIERPMLAVSLAAGIPLRVLSESLGTPVRWARAMPSPVCRSGQGLTGLCLPSKPLTKDRKQIRAFFGSFGSVVEIQESRFDAFTVTYSCSHGYLAVAALADAAQEVGLDRKTALLASAHALADGIVAWRKGEHSLAALLEEAITPGGIAASAAHGMDVAGYKIAVRKGLAAGLKRARANARQ